MTRFSYVRVSDRGYEYDVAYDRGAPYAAFVIKHRRGRGMYAFQGPSTYRQTITSPRKLKRLFNLAREKNEALNKADMEASNG